LSLISWRGKLKQDPGTGLFVRATADDMAAEVKARRFRKGFLNRSKSKTIYSSSGRPIVEVRVDEAGNSEHEYDDRQDAVARPGPVVVNWSEFVDQHPVLMDSMSVSEATVAYDRARVRVTGDPRNSEALAQWSRAKIDLNAARTFERMNKRG